MKTSIIVAVLAALFIAVAFWLVWINRASERILTAVIPITVAAVVGIALSIFVFGGQPPIVVGFRSSFQYQTASKLPRNFPSPLMSRRFTNVMFAPASLFGLHPEYFNDPSDSTGQVLYHDLLQWAIIDWLSMHDSHSWRSEASTYELPVGMEGRFGPIEGATEASTIFSSAEIEKLLAGNRFGSIDPSLLGPLFQIAVPPGTSVSIMAPGKDVTAQQNGEILFSNRFCKLSIRTQRSTYIMAVGGLKDLAGLTDEENKALGTASYTVRITAKFTRMLSGNPKMPLYKSWAEGIANGLKEQFDEELIWTRTRSDYLFFKQVQQFGPVN
jgi:hypothetical protein